MVPWTMVPFFSSMETVSLFSFIKNLLSMEKRRKKNQSSDLYKIDITKEEERKITMMVMMRSKTVST